MSVHPIPRILWTTLSSEAGRAHDGGRRKLGFCFSKSIFAVLFDSPAIAGKIFAEPETGRTKGRKTKKHKPASLTSAGRKPGFLFDLNKKSPPN
ncbi:MAG: hypothetical protein ACUVRM_10340 [Bacillota bacterium]